MKKIILFLLAVSPSTFAACPDFNGLYMAESTAPAHASNNGANTGNTNNGTPSASPTPSQTYNYMLIQQTGCENIVIKSLDPSGVTTDVSIAIGNGSISTQPSGMQIKADWNKTKLVLSFKLEGAGIDASGTMSLSRYDDGIIEITEFRVSSPQASVRTSRIWEKLQ